MTRLAFDFWRISGIIKTGTNKHSGGFKDMTKIAIVEDDPMISEIYQKKFSQSEFEVFAVESGDQLLNLAKKENLDVVLLDLIMPKMDGFEVIKNLRNGNYSPKTKIIVFSNLSQKEDREKALKLGANGFITKSDYTPTEMVKEITRLMNQFREEEKNEKRMSGEMDEEFHKEIQANGKKKILMIEDEEIFLEMFGEKLRQEGYSVSLAKNGAWGIKEALKEKYDLFIIDMVMPAMTGEEIVAKFKMEDSTRDVPIIVLSASVEDNAARKVKEMGVNAFFVKTQLIPSELAKKVGELLGEK